MAWAKCVDKCKGWFVEDLCGRMPHRLNLLDYGQMMVTRSWY
jgi:hypothetical protein